MKPAIPVGTGCLLRALVESTRQNKTVLVWLRDAIGSETGQRSAAKHSEMVRTARCGSWHHKRVTLRPVSPEIEPIGLTGRDDGQLRVVAVVVDVLRGEA